MAARLTSSLCAPDFETPKAWATPVAPHSGRSELKRARMEPACSIEWIIDDRWVWSARASAPACRRGGSAVRALRGGVLVVAHVLARVDGRMLHFMGLSSARARERRSS